MSGPAGLKIEVDSLRERLSRFRDAALRINESLDLDVVLQGVLDSARTLTGGRYALISPGDEDQIPAECLTSGLTSEQAEEFLQRAPPTWELFNFLVGIEQPLRVDDFQGYLKDHGFSEFVPPFPVSEAMACLATPIRHRGQWIGCIYVTEKDGGFTADDEETLAVLASQAALVISNARRYRGEQRARADLEALVSTAPMSVFVFNAATGAVTSINRVARRLLGDLGLSIDSVQELIGAVTIRRADGRRVLEEGRSVEDLLNTGETLRDEEITAELPDGRSIVALVNATPIRSPEGSVESVVVALQDLTPLAEAERLRSEFLGVVGHELRLPLAGIKGSVTTLLQGESSLDPAEMTQFLKIIDEQADYMRDLLSDLIDVVRIETGTLTVNPAPIEVTRLVEDARNTFLAAGGRQNIRITFPSDLPPVLADRRRIVQVVNNLLVNASRHSHEASPVRIEAWQDDLHIAVSVADNGRGLTAERLPHLFAKFSHPDAPDRGRDLGLGLAICKGIVEAHGGRIWAESDGPGLGSRFTFTIPVSEAPIGISKQGDAPSRQTNRQQIRVLAVDDDPHALKHIRDSLTEQGHLPTVTGDPQQVASLIEETQPHVILLDLMLPGTDGLELMQTIPAVRNTPVIFLSAYSQDEVIAKALEVGAADYIIKPFSPTELAARVKAALRNKPTQPSHHLPGHPTPHPFTLGDLTIDYTARTVTVADHPVNLTHMEYNLLAELSTNPGIPQTHEQLLRKVWGPTKTHDAQRLRTVIKNLRHKLGDNAKKPKYITTMPRYGYRMTKP